MVKERNLRHIKISRQYRTKPKLKWVKDILGFDTETFNGQAFLIACSDGRYSEINSFNQAAKFLTYYKYRKTTNFFWNLEYDFQAIISYLSEKYLEELYYFKKVKYKDWEIRYIPRKYFRISKNRAGAAFYDLFQYYKMSLNNAAVRYLKKHKIDLKYDIFKDWREIQKQKSKIIDYCLHDAKLCQQLGEFISQMFKKAGIGFTRPLSPAKLSMRYFLATCDIPKFQNRRIQQYALWSYHGGRFEVLQRGYFDNAYLYDLNSAYPAEIANLLDVRLGYWVRTNKLLDDSYYGFFKVKVSCGNKWISPLAFEKKQLVVFPRTQNITTYITLNELKTIVDKGIGKVKILDSYQWIPSERKQVFPNIPDLYRKRLYLKQAGDPLDLVFKVVLNSLYGKFIELQRRLIPVKTGEFAENLVHVMKGEKAGVYKRIWVAGQLYFPIYASIITSNVRLKIFSAFWKADCAAVAGFTDSIFTTEKIFKSSDKLGEWSFVDSGEFIVVGTGLYTFKGDRKTKTAWRGYHLEDKIDLFEILQKGGVKQTVKIPQKQLVKLGQWLLHRHALKNVPLNEIINVLRELDVNFDKKRKWHRKFSSCRDVLRSTILSSSLLFSRFLLPFHL